jgi:hypothetical protein
MNADISALQGKAKSMALESRTRAFKGVDNGEDDRMNQIIWYYTKGDIPYPGSKAKQKNSEARSTDR